MPLPVSTPCYALALQRQQHLRAGVVGCFCLGVSPKFFGFGRGSSPCELCATLEIDLEDQRLRFVQRGKRAGHKNT